MSEVVYYITWKSVSDEHDSDYKVDHTIVDDKIFKDRAAAEAHLLKKTLNAQHEDWVDFLVSNDFETWIKADATSLDQDRLDERVAYLKDREAFHRADRPFPTETDGTADYWEVREVLVHA